MFGKTRDLNDTTHLDGPTIEDFFGDESAAAEVVRVDELHHRVAQVESQINSQFTSLATYAQIAQEQIELARAEAKASTERSEQRLTELIERERADRIVAEHRQRAASARPATSRPGSTHSSTASPRSDRHPRRVLRPAARPRRGDQQAVRVSTGHCAAAATAGRIVDRCDAAGTRRRRRISATSSCRCRRPDRPVAIPGLSLCLDIA